MQPHVDHYLLEIEDVEDHSQVHFPPFLRVIEDVTGNPAYSNSNIAKMETI